MKKLAGSLSFALVLLIVPLPIRAQEQAITIVGPTVRRVDPGRYLVWSFDVPVYVRDGRVVGSVEAAGGKRNDIRVLVLTELQFQAWSRGQRTYVLYDSGQRRSVMLSVPASDPGRYYVIFDNSFSLVSPKNVLASVRWVHRGRDVARAEAAGREAVILMLGMGSKLDHFADHPINIVKLRLQHAYGWPETSFFRFSYNGGYWLGNDWVPNPYTSSDTFKAPSESAKHAARLVRELKERGRRVAMIGFSLGGLVAIQALSQPEGGQYPDVVVALASPLQGIDEGKRVICRDAKLTAFLGGLELAVISSPLFALGGGGVAAWLEQACGQDPLVLALESMARDWNWRVARDNGVRQLVQQGKVKVMTVGGSNDCLYYVILCSKTFGGRDADMREATFIQGVNIGELYPVPHSMDGIEKMLRIHKQILEDPLVLDTIVRFIGSRESRFAADQRTITSMRSAIAIYYGKHNGNFPPDKAAVEALVSPSPTWQCAGQGYSYDATNGKITLAVNDVGSCY